MRVNTDRGIPEHCIDPLGQTWWPPSIQNLGDCGAQPLEGPISGPNIVDQEMADLVRQRETQFVLRVAAIKEDDPLAAVGYETPVQDSVWRSDAKSDAGLCKAPLHILDAQAWHLEDRQRQGPRHRTL